MGLALTNVFKGTDRHTEFHGEVLVEVVTVKHVAPHTYYVIWEDAERGIGTMTINLDTKTVVTAITMEGQIAVMPGAITAFKKS